MSGRIIALVNNHKQEIIALKDFRHNFPDPEMIYGEIFDIQPASRDGFVEVYKVSGEYGSGTTTTFVDSLAYNPIYLNQGDGE